LVNSSGGNGAVLIISKRPFAIRENHGLNSLSWAQCATTLSARNETSLNFVMHPNSEGLTKFASLAGGFAVVTVRVLGILRAEGTAL
jgi:hypothetical protein